MRIRLLSVKGGTTMSCASGSSKFASRVSLHVSIAFHQITCLWLERGGGDAAKYAELEEEELIRFRKLSQAVQLACGSPSHSSNQFDWKIRVWTGPWLAEFDHKYATMNLTDRNVWVKQWIRALWARFPDMHPHSKPRHGMSLSMRTAYEKVRPAATLMAIVCISIDSARRRLPTGYRVVLDESNGFEQWKQLVSPSSSVAPSGSISNARPCWAAFALKPPMSITDRNQPLHLLLLLGCRSSLTKKGPSGRPSRLPISKSRFLLRPDWKFFGSSHLQSRRQFRQRRWRIPDLARSTCELLSDTLLHQLIAEPGPTAKQPLFL